MSDELDSLLTSFRPLPPGAGPEAPSPAAFSTQGTARFERRERKEKRAQASEKQIARPAAVRTDQINFRCSPQFKADIKALADALGKSIADVAEDAIRPLIKKHLKDRQP